MGLKICVFVHSAMNATISISGNAVIMYPMADRIDPPGVAELPDAPRGARDWLQQDVRVDGFFTRQGTFKSSVDKELYFHSISLDSNSWHPQR